MKKLVFFYKNKNDIPDILREYYKLSGNMTIDNDVYYINHWNDNILNELQQKNVKFIDVESNNYSGLEDATFICPVNYLFILIDKIKDLKTAKIILLNWQNASMGLFVNQLKVLGINNDEILNLINIKKGLVSSDANNRLVAQSLGYKHENSKIVPIPYDFKEAAHPIGLKKIEDTLNVAWVGNINSLEINSVINIADNLYNLDGYDKIDFHIIGEGAFKFKVNIEKYSPKIRFIYTSRLEEDKLEQYIDENVNVVFALNKDVLDVIRIGAPVFIPPVSSEKFNVNKYVAVNDIKGFALSWTPANLKRLGFNCLSMSKVIEMISDENSRSQLVDLEYKIVSEHFSIMKTQEILSEAINLTKLCVNDILNVNGVATVCRESREYGEFIKYFNHKQDKHNIKIAGAKAQISSLIKGMAGNIVIAPAKKLKHYLDKKKAIKWYNMIQNSYPAKIEKIRQVYEKEGRLKVAFLLIFDSVFPGEPVFEKMLNDDMFDPYIIVIPDVDTTREYKDLMLTYNKTVITMKEKFGDRVIEGFNKEDEEYLQLGEDYQIVFFANPYKHLAHPYHEVEYFLNKNVLPLYICYGYAAIKYARGLLELDFYNLVWKVYLESYANYEDYKIHQPVKGRNAMVSGYIKMDKLEEIPRIEKARKRILICPHHTVMGWDKLNISNFIQYSELFVKLPEMYPQIDFVFRPHPLLFSNLIEKRIWTKDRLNEYMERLLCHENMIYDNKGDYFETFANSDGMIHDCGSFIGEYLYTEKPCCYMLKSPEDLKTVFLPIGEMCMENYYKAYCEKDIIEFLDDVIIKEKDVLKEKREKFCKNTLKINYPNATDQVIKSIKDVMIKK